MIENKQLLIDFCLEHDYRIRNTDFERNDKHKCTYGQRGGNGGPPYGTTQYWELDHVLINNRCKDSTHICSSDPDANIASDHFPITTTLKTRLQKAGNAPIKRKTYQAPTQAQDETFKTDAESKCATNGNNEAQHPQEQE